MGDVDSVLRRGIADRRFAGAAAQVLIGEDVVHRQVVGDAVSVGERVSLWEGARFDIASLTKVVGTTAALMSLVSSRQVAVDDPLDRYVQSPHAGITLRHLLTHRAGLAEWQPLYLASEGRASAAALVSELPLRYAVGEGRHYSDLGMILLGRVVEEATGLRLDAAVTTSVAQPLGLEHTAYGPVEPALAVACGHGDDIEQAMIREGEPYPVIIEVGRSAPWRSGINRGEVSDGNAFHAMESVSGHAGLFSTLDDLSRFGATLFDESPIASRSTLDEFLDPGPEGQALGWWWRGLDGGPAFVHSGFTGCRLLVDRRRRLVAVLLTNRLHVMEPGVRLGPDIQPIWDDYLAATGVLTS